MLTNSGVNTGVQLKLPHHWTSSAVVALASRHCLLYLVMGNALQTLPCSTRTHLYHLFAGGSTCLYHAEHFPKRFFGKTTQLYPDLYPNPQLLPMFPCHARHLEKGVISVTGSERSGDFVLVDHQVFSPWKAISFLSTLCTQWQQLP